MFQEPSGKPDFTFRCQFLGTKDIRREAMYIEPLKEIKAQAGGFYSEYMETSCKLCITKTAGVWIEQEGHRVGVRPCPEWKIICTIQDPDDKTVFGYVCCSPLSFTYLRTLYAFKSEAEVIIRILSKYAGAATNILTEAAGSLYGAGDLSQNLTHLQEQLQEKGRKKANLLRQSENFQNQVARKNDEYLTLQSKLQQLQSEVSILQRQRAEQSQEVDEMRRQKANVETQLRQKEQQQLRERDQVAAQNQRLREMERQLAQREKSSYDWIICRNEVQVTDKRLGSGGWGTVYEGRYCGCAVAVKRIHEEIASPFRLKIFQREIDMASKCRHPCLLQFIGAIIDEDCPLLVTELMETSLRRLLNQRSLSIREVSIISLDVARALNYLHRKRPVPMIHRDVNCANVFLWRQAGRKTGIQEVQWRGKVSDYGTAKFVEQVMTRTPGCLAYSAPEARTTTQTAKIDVYSFGVLLCEMCIQEPPEPERRDEQVDKMSNRTLQELVRQCLQTNPDDRPDMTKIIDKLEKFQEMLQES
ncbi:unnamed protein product [Pocillopora meandrina]|uniref:Protein kinase domain-containing protein n=1 Tax=Pocillopora meandrina TaxID=46732 RepID=A0AAU9Y3C5_9CNID|nr:unnamed protein product [Pocillopora meandrina]